MLYLLGQLLGSLAVVRSTAQRLSSWRLQLISIPPRGPPPVAVGSEGGCALWAPRGLPPDPGEGNLFTASATPPSSRAVSGPPSSSVGTGLLFSALGDASDDDPMDAFDWDGFDF